MNNEIKDFILKELHIESESFQKQMTELDSQLDKLKELLDSIEDIKVELRKQESHKIMREWQSQIEVETKIPLAQDEHSFGVQLSNQVWLGIWDGYDTADNLPYWGFQLENYKKSEMTGLFNLIVELLNKVGIKNYNTEEKDFVAWYTTTQEGAKKFLLLYKGAQEMGLL